MLKFPICLYCSAFSKQCPRKTWSLCLSDFKSIRCGYRAGSVCFAALLLCRRTMATIQYEDGGINRISRALTQPKVQVRRFEDLVGSLGGKRWKKREKSRVEIGWEIFMPKSKRNDLRRRTGTTSSHKKWNTKKNRAGNYSKSGASEALFAREPHRQCSMQWVWHLRTLRKLRRDGEDRDRVSHHSSSFKWNSGLLQIEW